MDDKGLSPEQIRAHWHAWLDQADDRALLLWHNTILLGSTQLAMEDALRQIDSYMQTQFTLAAPMEVARAA